MTDYAPGGWTAHRHVVVVGGGIAGLAAAHALERDAPEGTRITLVEASDRLGGKLRTEEFGGGPYDVGAEAWLARTAEATRLAAAVGLDDELVTPRTSRAYVWVHGVMRPLPERTVLGVPLGWWPLAQSGVLSNRALLRAGLEPLVPGRLGDVPVGVGAYVSRRFGRQVVERLVDPLLGGVYAGHADDLDLDAAAPSVAALARAHRSVLRPPRAVRRQRRHDGRGAPRVVFHSLPGGVERLVRAVAARLDADVLLDTRAATLERLPRGFRLSLAGGRALVADAVVVATPAPQAGKLLGLVSPEASRALGAVQTANVAVVALAYHRRAVRPLPGSGFLVPESAGTLVKACTFSSQKWDHYADRDEVLLRASVGRAGENVDLDDDALVAQVHAELTLALRLRATPRDAAVARWTDALPQYAVGHGTRVRAVLDAVSAIPGLAVAGATYDGVGVPACIRTGEAAAARVVAHLSDARMRP